MQEDERKEFKTIRLCWLALLAILAICLFIGCTTLDKAVEKATETQQNAEITQYALHNKYPNVTAAFSATAYPISESSDTETTIEQGNVQEFKDKASKAEAKADSLLEALNSLPVKPECKDEARDRDKVIYALQQQLKGLNSEAQHIRADKETVVTKVTKESTAKLSDCQHKQDSLKVKLLAEKQQHLATLEAGQQYKKERNQAYIALAVLGVLIILAILRKFRIV